MLNTVADVFAEARVLLQDTVVPYRYADAELIRILNIAIMEARRLRPDLFLGQFTSLPAFASTGDAFNLEPMYRPAFVYYLVGRAALRNDEATEDARATVLMNKFAAQLLTIAS